MVLLSRIYTRGGDKGRTALGDGRRVAKHALRVEAYGTVDEANAAIGIARLHAAEAADAMLGRIQNDLFDLGADLCRPEGPDDAARPPLRVTADQVLRLEREIDAMNADLEPLRSFVLPGGTPAASHLHLARTITRRAERRITALMVREPVNPEALRYCNRLSDHLFVLARWVNRQSGGSGDVLWIPGANRT
jgi:cob(I)alamin adenosyltransferase